MVNIEYKTMSLKVKSLELKGDTAKLTCNDQII